MRTIRFALAFSALVAVPACAQVQPAPATVPLVVEGNRPYVSLTFTRADGSKRTARFLIDTGGGGFLLSGPLAADLGLELGERMREEGREFATVRRAPTVSVDAFPLTLDDSRVFVMIGTENILPAAAPGHADGMLPGHVLARYHVVFDYPAGTFTIAAPGTLTPRGSAMPMPVAERSGFPYAEIVVDGTTYGMLLDTGASFTMISDSLLKGWGARHAEWSRHAGAHGDAATLGGQTIETMYPPRATWGPHDIVGFGVTSQGTGTFEQYMSRMMAKPIMGALAGNVLRNFRVELDYRNQRLYLAPQ